MAEKRRLLISGHGCEWNTTVGAPAPGTRTELGHGADRNPEEIGELGRPGPGVEVEQQSATGVTRLGSVRARQLFDEKGVERSSDDLTPLAALSAVGDVLEESGELRCRVVG
jgi:hypothetical protein